jgi:hypothetical protein
VETPIIQFGTVDMHAEHTDPLAAVRLAAAAGHAAHAGDVGNDGDPLPRAQAAARRSLHDLARELVADDARVFEKGLLAPKDVKVRAADAGPADAHQDLAGRGRGRGPLDENEPAGLLAENGSHLFSSSYLALG